MFNILNIVDLSSHNLLHSMLITLFMTPFLILLIPASKKKLLFSLVIIFQLFSFLGGMLLTLNGETPSIHLPLMSSYGINYNITWNPLNQYLVILTCFIFPLALSAGFLQIKDKFKLFCIFLTLCQFLVVETFLVQNLILFYLFWESSIIPMLFIIGLWGGSERIFATFKFLLFTSFGSLMMLLSILYLGVSHYQIMHTVQFDLNAIKEIIPLLPMNDKLLLFIGFSLAFIIKIPVPPFHHWLPYAHVEAPTAGSMILAAILLKLGSYGFLQYSLFLFPDVFAMLQLPLVIFFIIGAIYAGMIALVQDDLKRIVAYSSISHMGVLMWALCFFHNPLSLNGAMLSMIGHGLTSAGLFFAVGVLYDRLHTRSMTAIGQGLATSFPRWSLAFFLLLLSSIGFPLTVGFSGEFMIFAGSFQWALEHLAQIQTPIYLVLCYLSLSIILIGTLYHMRIVKKIIFGTNPSTSSSSLSLLSLNKMEGMIFLILIIPILILGLFPNIMMFSINF